MESGETIGGAAVLTAQWESGGEYRTLAQSGRGRTDSVPSLMSCVKVNWYLNLYDLEKDNVDRIDVLFVIPSLKVCFIYDFMWYIEVVSLLLCELVFESFFVS